MSSEGFVETAPLYRKQKLQTGSDLMWNFIQAREPDMHNLLSPLGFTSTFTLIIVCKIKYHRHNLGTGKTFFSCKKLLAMTIVGTIDITTSLLFELLHMQVF